MGVILVTGGLFAAEAFDALRRAGHLVNWFQDSCEHHDLDRLLAISDAFIVADNVYVSAKMLRKAPRLHTIVVLASAYSDWVDVTAAARSRIEVFGTPTISAGAVAEHTVGLMLAAARRIVGSNNMIRKGFWEEFQVPGLRNRSLGIVGLGAIGAEVARIASSGLGMRVHYFSRRRKPELELSLNIKYQRLNDLLASSDVITLHCPLSDDTRMILGSEAFALLKPGAILVNTGRAWLVDPSSLYTALSSDRLACAAFDVYYEEPASIQEDSNFRLLSLPSDKFILTPHIAYLTEQTMNAMSLAAAKRVISKMKRSAE